MNHPARHKRHTGLEERLNIKGMACSLGAHALVIGVLLLFVGAGVALPPPVEDGIISMQVVDAGSGNGMAASPQDTPEPPAVIEPPAPALPPVEPASVPEPPEEPEPSAEEAVDPAPQPEPPKKQEKPKPRVKPQQTPPKAAQTGGTGKGTQAATSKGPGTGGGTGSGNFSSKNSGRGDGQASSTTLSVLMARLERYKSYPTAARRLGLEGVVLVEVYIGKDGTLNILRLADDKAHPILQKATEKMLDKVRDSWKVIQGGQEVNLLIPVRYTLQDG